MKRMLYAALLCATTAHAAFDLQQAINKARPGATVVIPKGIYTQPITVGKGIVLKGNGSTLAVESTSPAILVDTGKKVGIQGLEIQWKIKGKLEKGGTSCAVFVRAGEVTVQGCRFKALGSGKESPCALFAQGDAEVKLKNCRFEGFEFAIQFWNGAEGNVVGCLVSHPGHCGITVGGGAKVGMARNIVTGSSFHGIRCTGGKIEAESNWVAGNKNRGFYIGNKSAIGHISNNVIIDNGTGIDVFAQSGIDVENNVIMRSAYAGLSIADTAKVETEGNMIVDNEAGILGFSSEEGKETRISLNDKNLLFGNKLESENIKLPSKTLREDPRFEDPENGNFATPVKEMGLEEPAELQTLWEKWQAALEKGK